MTRAFSPRSSSAFSLLKSRASICAASPNQTAPLVRLITAILPAFSAKSPAAGSETTEPIRPVAGSNDWIWFEERLRTTMVRPSWSTSRLPSGTRVAVARSLIEVLTMPSRARSCFTAKIVPSCSRRSATL